MNLCSFMKLIFALGWMVSLVIISIFVFKLLLSYQYVIVFSTIYLLLLILFIVAAVTVFNI